MLKRLSLVSLVWVLAILMVACAPPNPEPENQLIYYVQEGDTIKSIADKYDISESELRLANDLPPDKPVGRGQPLIIPVTSNKARNTARPTAAPLEVQEQISRGCFQAVSNLEQPYSNYLPLNTGNYWTYHRTVLQDVYTWEAYQTLNEGTVTFVVMTVPGIQPGDSEETYRVLAPDDEIGLWKMEISDPLSRDGRYGGGYTKPDQILWGRVPSSEEIIEIDEILIKESYFEGTKKYETVLLAQSLIEGAEVTLMLSNSKVTYAVSSTWTEITVPAGTFPCTLEVVTQVVSDYASWEIFSYFAPGVGLVKEMQIDGSGQAAYTMELVEYHVSTAETGEVAPES